jgi:SAM-dependent methyltransferase
MQAYGAGFARVYNLRWSGFARQVAPLILEYFEALPFAAANKRVLDLCCGTGQLALYFLEKGYRVVGIDLSSICCARQREYACMLSGQAKFIAGDATDFTLDERFDLVVSTFDALNHLEDEQALRRCFQCVFPLSEGLFIFDLNTRIGLSRWNNIQMEENEEALVITRGIFDGQGDRAWTKISGFIHTGDKLYERFEETAFNTVFELERVENALHEAGWRKVHFARLPDLKTPITEPEKEGRVFIVASK